jgi:hypothetical protein
MPEARRSRFPERYGFVTASASLGRARPKSHTLLEDQPERATVRCPGARRRQESSDRRLGRTRPIRRPGRLGWTGWR